MTRLNNKSFSVTVPNSTCGIQYSSLLKFPHVIVFHGDKTDVKLTPFILNLRSRSEIKIEM